MTCCSGTFKDLRPLIDWNMHFSDDKKDNDGPFLKEYAELFMDYCPTRILVHSNLTALQIYNVFVKKFDEKNSKYSIM